MKPAARPFYRSAVDSLEHARQHAAGAMSLDTAQVILSLDYAIEMLLKAVLLERGESIMDGRRSIGLPAALKRAGTYANGPTVEILRERRDNLQHLAAGVDVSTTQDLYEGALLFIEEVLRQDFGLAIPVELRIWAAAAAIPLREVELVAPSERLQRDVHASGDAVVWAEATPEGQLAVVLRARTGAFALTPPGQFEYMPRTDGRFVAAYRQSGGVVLYDSENHSRCVVAETGGPTDVRDGFVAVQGLGVEGGLGGGVWLYSIDAQSWEQVSEGGDSARLTSGHVVWQEFAAGSMTVRRRQLIGGPTEVVLEGGGHPSPSEGLLAWADWPGTQSVIHVSDHTGHELVRTTGIFPHLHQGRLALLRPTAQSHDLLVLDVGSGVPLLEVGGVGFPTGGGPLVTNAAVYFESRTGRNVHAIFRAELPPA